MSTLIKPTDFKLDASTVKHSTSLLFGTPVWISRLKASDATAINSNLENLINKEFSSDPKGIQSSNKQGTWHSRVTLHEDQAFIDAFLPLLKNVLVKTAFQTGIEKGWSIELEEMWAMINVAGSRTSQHIHSPSHISGSYYVKVPKNSGNLIIREPRTQVRMSPWPVEKNTEKIGQYLTRTTLNLEPEEGTFVMFPSWLEHEVSVNKVLEEDSKRMCLTFNASFVYTGETNGKM
tara:strand:+ start:6006 stop:6707 length:702 start_codon:yes stop_codon:yes gene_type:complete